MSWQTRQLASFTAGGYMTDGKKGNPALDAARKLAYDAIEEAQLEEAELRSANGGALVWGKNEKGEDVVVEIVPDLPSNLPTWEQTANVFGDPSKWRTK